MYFQDTFTLSNSRDPWMKGREGRTNRIRQGLIPSFKQHWVCVMIFCINTQSNILRIEMTAAYLNQVFSDTIFVYPFSFFLCSLCKPRFFQTFSRSQLTPSRTRNRFRIFSTQLLCQIKNGTTPRKKEQGWGDKL